MTPPAPAPAPAPAPGPTPGGPGPGPAPRPGPAGRVRLPLMRGRVYGAVLSHIGVEKYFLVVSNNVRNRSLQDVLAVRLTTSTKPDLDSIVRLGPTEVFTGLVCCDDVTVIYPDEVTRDLGALSRDAMAKVRVGLASALGLLPLG